MAIYHLSAQVISRHNKGRRRSVVAAAAYRSGAVLWDGREGRSFDYSHKGARVHYHAILAPRGARDWTFDQEALWNEINALDTRYDSQLAREINLALPIELSHGAQRRLLHEFVSETFVEKGFVVDVAIHRAHTEEAVDQNYSTDDDEGPWVSASRHENPHAHIMITMRRLQGGEFEAKKPRPKWWKRKERLIALRKAWADHANRVLQEEGHLGCRIDHRSYADRGIDQVAQPHLYTSLRSRLLREGASSSAPRTTRRYELLYRNGERLVRDPGSLLALVAEQKAVFRAQDLLREAVKRTADKEQHSRVFKAALGCKQLIPVGHDADGKPLFTTLEHLQIERNLLADADHLAGLRHVQVRLPILESCRDGHSLSEEQYGALVHLTASTGQLAILEGYAGTGKSRLLAAAGTAWQSKGCRVYGSALTGKASAALQGAEIPTHTIAAWEHAWSKGREELRKGDVFVVDEAGMVGSAQLGRVLKYVKGRGAKLVLVGDSRQLQAIEAGSPLKALGERFPTYSLTEVRRQATAWQRLASKAFGRGEVGEAFDAYKGRGSVHEHTNRLDAMDAMVREWSDRRAAAPNCSQLLLAFRNTEVDELNSRARDELRDDGKLGDERAFALSHRGESYQRQFAPGERVYFLKNDRKLDVQNGTLGTLTAHRGSVVSVDLDDGTSRDFDTADYPHLEYGYAATIYKAQGATVDHAHVLTSPLFDQHAAYVACTRHTDSLSIHWHREAFRSEQYVKDCLGRDRREAMAVDLHEASRAKGPRLHFESRFHNLSSDAQERYLERMDALARREPANVLKIVEGLDDIKLRKAKAQRLLDAYTSLTRDSDRIGGQPEATRELKDATVAAMKAYDGARKSPHAVGRANEKARMRDHETAAAGRQAARLRGSLRRKAREGRVATLLEKLPIQAHPYRMATLKDEDREFTVLGFECRPGLQLAFLLDDARSIVVADVSDWPREFSGLGIGDRVRVKHSFNLQLTVPNLGGTTRGREREAPDTLGLGW